MRGKKRPTDERARAVGIAVVAGGAEASRQTGIPETTIHAWLHAPEFEELRRRNKEQVAEEWWGVVQLAFRRTAELIAKTDDAVKAATAGAIVFDKLALTRGEATTRSETRALSEGLPDDEKQRLRDFIDTLPTAAPAGEPGDAASDPG